MEGIGPAALFTGKLGRVLGELTVKQQASSQFRVLRRAHAFLERRDDLLKLPLTDPARLEARARVIEVRVGNPERQVKRGGAVGADRVLALGRAGVTLPHLGSVRVLSELYSISLDHAPPDPELEPALGLVEQ